MSDDSQSMSEMLRRFCRTYYAYVFLFDFILCYAIYTAYFEFQGLSYVQIGLLLAIWSGSALVLELFSGALSDRFDRRWLLIAAPLIKSLTFVCWAKADGNFWIYGLGFVLWSFGQSLFSGTAEALLYERVERAGQEDRFDKLYGRASAMESLGVSAGLLIGGFVAARNMELSIWLSIPPLMLAAGLAVFLRDTRRDDLADDAAERPGYFNNFKLAIAEFQVMPELRFVTLYIVIGLILFEELEEFDQLFYVAVNLPIWLFGVVGALALALSAFGSAQAFRLAQFPALAWVLPGLGGVLLIVASLADNAYYVIVLEFAYLVAVPAGILAEARFQNVIEGKARATTTSVLYLLQNVVAMLIALIFGALAGMVGILPAYGWAGVAMGPVCVWIWWHQRNGARVF